MVLKKENHDNSKRMKAEILKDNQPDSSLLEQ